MPFGDASHGRLVADFVPGQHACLIHSDDADHAAAVAPFVRQGLERGERVVYLTDSRSPRDVRDILGRAGVACDAHEARGQLVVQSAEGMLMTGGRFDAGAAIARFRDQSERARVAGFGTLRVTGEMTWGLGDRPGFWHFESAINALFQDIGAIGLCQFDRRRFEEPALLEAMRTHPWVVVGVEMHHNDYHVTSGRSTLEAWFERLRRRRKLEDELKQAEADILRLQIILDEFQSAGEA